MRRSVRIGGLRAPIGELLRYGAVGVGLVAIEYILYFVIVRAWPDAVVVANLVARLVAGIAGFVGHARFTFGGSACPTSNALRYAALLVANTLAASLLLMALLPLLGMLFAKLASDGITIAAAYLVSRYLVFVPAADREAAP
jgi:putative flippase GtrA